MSWLFSFLVLAVELAALVEAIVWMAAAVRALVNPASCLGDCEGVLLAGAVAWAIGLAWLVTALARLRCFFSKKGMPL